MSTSDTSLDETIVQSTEGKRLAFVVGVNNSSIIPPNWATLEYAEDDAKEVSYLLERPACKFKLVKPALIGKEATASHIRRAVVDLVMARTDQDLLLFYFSGHAQQMNDDIYFVTGDFDKGKVKVDPGGYISMRWLHRVLYQSIEAGCALIILDCCYAGNMAEARDDILHENFQTLLDKWEKGPHDKAQQNCSRLILAATGYDIEALENNGHGLMTRFLLRALGGDEDDEDKAYDNEGRVDILSLFKYLQKKLPKEHFSTLSGKFTAPWILASYPRLSEHFRQQIKDNELKSELGKEVSKNIMAELLRLYAATQHSQPFDYSICPYASFSDLDSKQVSEFFKQERVQQESAFHFGASDQDQLQMFDLLRDGYPTYGTLLCFGQNPSRWVSSAITRCVEWEGNERGDRLLNSREFRGPLLRQFELSRDFLRKSLRLSRVISREGSNEEWEIPFRVLEETLANALVHREYANRTDFVQVEVFDDRVEISNPGDLPPNVTIELLQTTDASYPRNPQIAGIFYLHGHIEKLGTGIQRIHRLMKDAELPDPEFKPADKRFKVILYRPRQIRDNFAVQGSVNRAGISATPSLTSVISPIWNVPFRRNPFFTGREFILTQLHTMLRRENTAALSQPPAISGLGGIGKTQTAVEYAYRYRDEYQHVLWVQANTHETLTLSYMTLAGLLNLPQQGAQDQSLTVQVVKNWLEQHDKWLLIFDNADDLSVVDAFLPTESRGHILFITRAHVMSGRAQRVEVEEMDAEEGALFLLRRTTMLAQGAPLSSVSETVRVAAFAIVEAVDGLPLALDQAGAYIEETGCGLSRYLELYQKQGAQLLKRRGGVVSDHPQPVATTWSLSFEKVERANPTAADLLRLCAFLSPDAIPEEIITEGAPDLGQNLEAVAADVMKLNDAIGELLSYSLVRRNPNQTLTIHPLVQAVLRDEMNERTQRQWAERAVRAVNRVFPNVEVSTWTECQRLLSHAQVCAVLIEQWHMEFEEAARLLNQTGQYLQARAQYAEAEPFYQLALTIREQILGSEHPDVAQSLNNLALLYQAQGKYEQVEPLYRRALAIDERVLGPEHPEVVTDLNNLALLYYNQRKYAEAEPLYRRALIIDEQLLGGDHPEVATDLNNLALLYQAQGKYDQAEPFLQRALATREKILGSEDPDTAISLNNLASLYYNQGKYIQAEPLLQRALMIWEKVLGSEHPSVATSLENYATLLRETEREEEAGMLEERARAIRARHAQENSTL